MSRYTVLSRKIDSVTVEAVVNTSTHGLLKEMVYDDVIPQWVADDITSKQGSMDVRAGETLTVHMSGGAGSWCWQGAGTTSPTRSLRSRTTRYSARGNHG